MIDDIDWYDDYDSHMSQGYSQVYMVADTMEVDGYE